MAGSELRTHGLHDLSHFGLRLAAGVFFMVHSQAKFGSGFGRFLSDLGLPPDLALPVGLLELVGGALLIVGVLSRISAAIIAVDMLGAMILVKKMKSFSGTQGVELELLAFVVLLTIAVLGPGRISLYNLIKSIPRSMQ